MTFNRLNGPILKCNGRDPCPNDPAQSLVSKRGIEVGHVFKLGQSIQLQWRQSLMMRMVSDSLLKWGVMALA